ncbi:VOC family protein [Sorangium sp. So ce542]|uniref:VOC family protein n=1 Tax=Sorangium sp. So ce542 TaxID=3133316 RepID=UPI003F61D056
MVRDIDHLHHVGHVVSDMKEGLELYRRLGFRLSPPAYPMLSPREGEPPRPFGAANTHADFRRNFVELVSCVRDDDPGGIPSDAKLVPIQAPPEHLPRLTEAIRSTVARIAACLARFQGLHILVFKTPDADAAAGRLGAEGIHHGGVSAVRRPVDTAKGPQVAALRFIELDSGAPEDAGAGRTPEGRLAIAENPPAELLEAQLHLDHPNGAVDLVDAVLCVDRAALPEVERRYATYLGRAARADGPARVFDLDGARVTLVADADLEALLPGERAPALPAFVAYTVAVRDASAARKLLEGNGFPLRASASGDLFVPAAAALGAAIVFRQADSVKAG